MNLETSVEVAELRQMPQKTGMGMTHAPHPLGERHIRPICPKRPITSHVLALGPTVSTAGFRFIQKGEGDGMADYRVQ